MLIISNTKIEIANWMFILRLSKIYKPLSLVVSKILRIVQFILGPYKKYQ